MTSVYGLSAEHLLHDLSSLLCVRTSLGQCHADPLYCLEAVNRTARHIFLKLLAAHSSRVKCFPCGVAHLSQLLSCHDYRVNTLVCKYAATCLCQYCRQFLRLQSHILECWRIPL